MLQSPYVIGVAAGLVSSILTYGLMEQELRRWKQYKRWKMKRVTERCSVIAGMFFGLITFAYNIS